ncbi:hypothetical protein [Nakamurella multipartita]|jgi:hypothetical protein|nr:hypothetical protein [Nakamurella multipartita]
MFTWTDTGLTELMDLLAHPSSALLRAGRSPHRPPARMKSPRM